MVSTLSFSTTKESGSSFGLLPALIRLSGAFSIKPLLIVLFLSVQSFCYASVLKEAKRETRDHFTTPPISYSTNALLYPGSIDSNQTICYGTAPAPILNTSTPTGSGTLTLFWQKSTLTPASGYNTIPGANALGYLPGTLTQSTWFRRGVTDGTDTSYTVPVKITIVVTPHSTITSAQTICSGTMPDSLTGPEIPGLNYQWIYSNTSANSGYFPANGINNMPNYTPGALTQNTWYRRVDALGSCSADTTSAIKISISPLSIGGTLSGGNIVCSGTNNTQLTLNGNNGFITNWQWSNSRDFSTLINNIAVTGNTLIVNNLTSSRYYRAVIVNPNCSTYPSSYSSVDSIIVSIPAIGGNVAGGATVCIGTAVPLTVTSYTGNVLRWESSPNRTFSSGVVAINNTSSTYTVTGVNTTTYYRAVIKSGPCPFVYSSIDSVVILKSIGGTISEVGGSCPVCPGPNSKTLALTGYSGSIIKWQSSPKLDFSSGVTEIPNTSNTYTVNNLAVSSYYRALVQYGSCYGQNSNMALVIVAPAVTPGQLSGGNSYCFGPNNTTLTLSGIEGGIVRWESCPNRNFTSGVTNITNTTTSLNVVNLSSTRYYRALIANGSVCPGKYSSIDSIIIHPLSSGGTVSGDHDTVCASANSTQLSLAGSTGAIQWQSSTTSDTSGFSNISGATNTTYTATNLSVKTYFRAIAVSGLCDADTSTVDSVLISTISVGGNVSSSNDIVCTDSNSTLFSLTGYTGAIQWQSSITSPVSGFSDIALATNDTFFATNLSEKTFFRALVTNEVCPSSISTEDSILINSISVGGIVSTQNSMVCIGNNSTVLTLTGSSGTVQWQASTSSAITGFSDIAGQNASAFTTNNLSDKTYYRAVVTNGVCLPSVSSVDSVLVSPLSVGGIVSGSNDTICTSNSTAFVISNYTGSIQWQSSTTSATTNFSNLTGSNDSIYVAGNLTGKTYFRAIVSSGVCPTSTSIVDSVFVNPVSLGGVLSGDNDTVCVTSSTAFTLTNYTGNIQWQTSTSSADTGFSDIIGASDSTYTAAATSDPKTYFRAIVTSGFCPSMISNVDSILTTPTSVGGIVSGSNDTVCTNNSTVFTLSDNIGNIQWQSSTSSATLGFSDIAGQNTSTYTTNNLSGKTYFRAIVTSGVCPSVTSMVDSVLVNTTIQNNNVTGNVRVCFGFEPGLLTGTIPTGGNGSTYSYLWLSSTVNHLSGFAPAPGINNMNDYTPGKLKQHTWFKRIVFSAPCSVDTSDAVMDTVSPDIAYIVRPNPVSIVYGTPLSLPMVMVKYVDSTSEMRPVFFDTTLYHPNVGSYEYPISIVSAHGTCNTKNQSEILSVTILPRPIVVKADIKIKAEATPDPPLTYTIISGSLVGSDTFSGTLSRLPGEAVGRYAILQNTLSLSPNYSLTYIPDSLTITINLMNITLSKTTPITFAYCGESVSYSILVTNNGPDSLQTGQNLTIKEQPGKGLNIEAYFTSNGNYDGNTGNLTLNNPFLPGETVELLVQASIDANYRGDTVGNFVLVGLPDYILNTGQSKDSAFVATSRIVDLTIQKLADKDTTQSSDTVTYTVVVKNNGPSKLYQDEDVFIREFLPDSLSGILYTAIRPSGSLYNQNSTAFTLGGDLPSGDSIILNVKGVVMPEYSQASITNCVEVKSPLTVYENDSTDNTLCMVLPVKQHALPENIIVSDQHACKGNVSTIILRSSGIINPVYTWYEDSLLTRSLGQGQSFDTLLLADASFFITVKGDNKLENRPGAAKKVTVSIFDYASDTLIITYDTIVCYRKNATLIAKPKGVITDPVFTWYESPELKTPIATGDTFLTGLITSDTLYYVTIKGSSLCESRELHIVRVAIDKDCSNMNIVLAKSLIKTTENNDGSYELTFNFVSKNAGDEPLKDVKLKDNLKQVFPTAQIKVMDLTTSGNWNLNNHYDGVNDVELLSSNNTFDIAERQSVQLVINVLFPQNDTSSHFKNIAEISGFSTINGKPMSQKSKDGNDPDSLTTDTSFIPTTIIIKHKPKEGKKPAEHPKEYAETVFIPEGFSPNGDNVNDYFVIDNPENYSLQVAVYNRWGNLVFESSNYDNSWDGKNHKGLLVDEDVPDGTYYYIVKYSDAGGNTRTKTHSLTIIR